MSSRLQSPILSPKPFPLASNDDDHERAQARAAIAASVRRRSAAFSPPPPPPPPPFRQPEDHEFLDDDQIMDLLQNCIKLANENKINQKNMWQLTLIDHLSEIIRAGPKDEGNETNFQKASCTLEAGVKIYSLRVDSVYSEAYKVLGGINRAGQEEIAGNMSDGDHTQTKQVQGLAKKDLDRKMQLSPLTTVEYSFEALNIKKFDVAFTVDPLYNQTSAQFDEGGAKGLLLNNFGVYGGCCVLFDSFELPEKTISSELQYHHANIIDLSFAKENIEQMIVHMHAKSDISPTLRDILSQFGEDNYRSSDVLPAAQQPLVQETNNCDHSEVGSDAFDDYESWNFGRDDHARFGVNEPTDSFGTSDANFSRHPDENGECVIGNPSIDQKLEKISDLLCLGLGFTSKSNAWAGPDHWKYRKAKGLEQMPCSDNESELASKEPKIKKGVPDLDFTKSLDMQMPNIFASPKNPKSLILLANRSPCIIKLPEDCQYRPENLVRLFLLPDFMCLGKKARKISDESMRDDNSIPFASCDDENTRNDNSDYPAYSSYTECLESLVHPPRQVNKVDIQYNKVPKQVDVHVLKDVLWSNIQESIQMSDVGIEATVSFKQVLHQFSSDSFPITSLPKDISPHLFFICLLQLANERHLSLHEHPTLDELDIHIPSSVIVE